MQILTKHIERAYKKVISLKMSINQIAVTVTILLAQIAVAVTVVLALLSFAPKTVQAQYFRPVQTNPFSIISTDNQISSPSFVDLDNDVKIQVFNTARQLFYQKKELMASNF